MSTVKRVSRFSRKDESALLADCRRELPQWLRDFFLVGILPSRGTPAMDAFHTLRYRLPRRAIRDVYMSHRASIIREAQHLGFTRPDEPHGEHLFARDENGLPLPLPSGVTRAEEGSPAPWYADRSAPEAQAFLKKQLAEQRALIGA